MYMYTYAIINFLKYELKKNNLNLFFFSFIFLIILQSQVFLGAFYILKYFCIKFKTKLKPNFKTKVTHIQKNIWLVSWEILDF